MPKFVADSVEATGLKWAAPSSGMTLIKNASFTTVSDTGTTFDGVFSTTYKIYKVAILVVTSTNANIHFQVRSGTTTRTASYESLRTQWNGTTETNHAVVTDKVVFGAGASSTNSYYNMDFIAGVSSGERTTGVASGYSMGNGAIETIAFQNASVVPSDGFILSGASGTITGYCLVWGLSQ